MRKRLIISFALSTVFILLVTLTTSAQSGDPLFKDSGWNYHLQFTGIIQAHPTFHSPYSGQNSLSAEHERAYSVTTTLYLGRHLWKGAALYFNPEMAGGKGVGPRFSASRHPASHPARQFSTKN